MDDFAGKVGLVTGAGRGLGREIALALASLGVAVAANDINPLNLDETVSQIAKEGGSARSYVFDIAKRMPIEGMVSQVVEHYGRIDILVNHASVKPEASLLEMDEWEFHRTLDVNLGGVFFTMQRVGRVMREHEGGSIVNLISSLGGDALQKGYAAFLASQDGLLGLTQASAHELAPHHIRVNAVCYGAARSVASLATGQMPTNLQTWRADYPQLVLGEHPDLVSLVLYLCSKEAADLNGQIIAVDEMQP